MKRSAAEVSEIIERFLDNVPSEYEWDDFTSIPIKNPFLNGVRLLCAHADSAFPSEPGSGKYCNDKGAELMRCIAVHLKWTK